MADISTRLNDFNTRMKGVENLLSDAKLNLQNAKTTVNKAHRDAQNTLNV